MYNRYIPRPDGSYSCNRIPEPRPHRQPVHPSPSPHHKQEQTKQEPTYEHRHKESNSSFGHSGNPAGFLRQLLGKDFDTGDIVVILLLLLMAGDSEEERSNAFLTIALYFLM